MEEELAKWQCEHGSTESHWQQNSGGGSRQDICNGVRYLMISIPWCPQHKAPARLCDHDPVDGMVWQRGRAD